MSSKAWCSAWIAAVVIVSSVSGVPVPRGASGSLDGSPPVIVSEPPYEATNATAEPSPIWVDTSPPGRTPREANVTLTIDGRGVPLEEFRSQDVVFLIDASGSMRQNDPANLRLAAAKHYVDLLNTTERAAVVSFNQNAMLVRGDHLSSDFARVKANIDTIGSSGFTNLLDPIRIATDELSSHGDGDHVWIEILLTDGEDTTSHSDEEILAQARRAADEGITIFTVGLIGSGRVDEDLLREIANATGGRYLRAEDANDLEAIYEEISHLVRYPDIAGRDNTVDAVLPAYVHYVPGTATPAPDYVGTSGNRTLLQWNFTALKINETWTATFRVTSSLAGSDLPVLVHPDSQVAYTRYDDERVNAPFPETRIDVISNRPPVANASGPYAGMEGGSIPFSAASSADPDGDPLTFRWDFQDDGTWDTNWSASPTAAYTWGDDWEGTVRVEVSDGDMTDTANASVVVNNAAPVIALTVIPSGNEAADLAFLAQILDPGSDDLAVTWTGACTGWSATRTYLNDPDVGPDPDPSPDVHARDVVDAQTVVCGDDGVFTWSLDVADDDGGVASATGSFSVDNLPPEYAFTFCPQIVGCGPVRLEGDVTSYWAMAEDPGSDDLAFTWRWGDGTPEVTATYYNNGIGPDPPNSPGGTFPFEVTDSHDHAYGDDGAYAIDVMTEDDDGGLAAITATVTILNVAPTVLAGPDAATDEGSLLAFLFAFSDPGFDVPSAGTVEDFTATVDWGDSVTETLAVDEVPGGPGVPTTGTVSGAHVYADNGVYTVTITVCDDDGGCGSDSLAVTVANVAPTVDPVADAATEEGSLLAFTFRFADPGFDFPAAGTMEDFTATVDWGDSVTETLAVDEAPGGPGTPTTGTALAAHVYADNGVYIVTITVCDDDGGCGSASLAVTVANVAPTVEAGPDRSTEEASVVAVSFAFIDPGFDFPAAGTMEDFTAIVDWGYGPSEVATVVEIPGGPGVPTRGFVNMTHVYGDDGAFPVTATVCDDDGGCGSDAMTVTVGNVMPTIEDLQAYVVADLTVRVAGEKWHDVRMDLVWNGDVTGIARVVRTPGSPDRQAGTITGGRLQLLGSFAIVVYYTPADDPVNGQPNGANPVWVILTMPDGSEVRLHHTFNVQHPSTWVWTISDLRPDLVGQPITFDATAHDVGSDDLRFAWSWGDGTPDVATTYYNNGVSPDPYPSPEVNPITANDVHAHAFAAAGTYTITLAVTDDDGGSTTATATIAIG